MVVSAAAISFENLIWYDDRVATWTIFDISYVAEGLSTPHLPYYTSRGPLPVGDERPRTDSDAGCKNMTTIKGSENERKKRQISNSTRESCRNRDEQRARAREFWRDYGFMVDVDGTKQR